LPLVGSRRLGSIAELGRHACAARRRNRTSFSASVPASTDVRAIRATSSRNAMFDTHAAESPSARRANCTTFRPRPRSRASTRMRARERPEPLRNARQAARSPRTRTRAPDRSGYRRRTRSARRRPPMQQAGAKISRSISVAARCFESRVLFNATIRSVVDLDVAICCLVNARPAGECERGSRASSQALARSAADWLLNPA
jgi:hypothetical protein